MTLWFFCCCPDPICKCAACLKMIWFCYSKVCVYSMSSSTDFWRSQVENVIKTPSYFYEIRYCSVLMHWLIHFIIVSNRNSWYDSCTVLHHVCNQCYLHIHYVEYMAFFGSKHLKMFWDPSRWSGWTNPPLMFHILWVAEVETWLLPLEVSHGGPLWPVPVRRGWGRMRHGGGHFRLKCGFQDGGGLWRMAMTAAFVLGSASFGTMGSEWCGPGEGAPHSLFSSEDRKAEQERSERRVKKSQEKYWLGLWTGTLRFRADPSCCYGFSSQS